jgi:hypothetical protein
MFDGNVHFIQKFGCTGGTEKLESHGRTSNIANHALALGSMVSAKKWKQPVHTTWFMEALRVRCLLIS